MCHVEPVFTVRYFTSAPIRDKFKLVGGPGVICQIATPLSLKLTMATTNEFQSAKEVVAPLMEKICEILGMIVEVKYMIVSNKELSEAYACLNQAQNVSQQVWDVLRDENDPRDGSQLKPYDTHDNVQETLGTLRRKIKELKLAVNSSPIRRYRTTHLVMKLARVDDWIAQARQWINEYEHSSGATVTRTQRRVERCQRYRAIYKPRKAINWADEVCCLDCGDNLEHVILPQGSDEEETEIVEGPTSQEAREAWERIPNTQRTAAFQSGQDPILAGVGPWWATMGDEPQAAVMQSTQEGNLVTGLLNRGLGFAGDLVRGAFGLPAGEDAPSVTQPNLNDWCNSDLPVPDCALTFKKVHRAPDAKSVIQAKDSRSMLLTERCKVPSLLASFSIDSGCASLAKLVGYVSVSPQAFSQWVPGPSGLIERTSTALSYYSEFFQLWRGNIDFDIQVIATEFHKGQIYLAFNPNNDDVDTSDVLNFAGLMGASFDISSQNQYTFKVPFVNDRDYKKIRRGYGPGTEQTGDHNRPFNALGDDESIGRLYIYTQTPIVAPATANPRIYINVWIKAGDRFAFSVPVWNEATVEVNGKFQSDTSGVAPTDNPEADDVLTHPEEDVVPGVGQDGIDTANPIAEVAELETASTPNILGRSFLVLKDAGWATTDNYGAVIMSALIPDILLTNARLPPKGLMDYHEFFRGGVTVTVQMASQKQYCGLAILAFIPVDYDRDLTKILNTLTQLPFAFLDAGRQTTVSLHVPFTAITRLLRVSKSYKVLGEVKLIVINPLLAPQGACTTLRGTMQVRVNKPYIGVKRAPKETLVTFQNETDGMAPVTSNDSNPAGEPSEKTNETSEVACKGFNTFKPGPRRNPVVGGFIAPHMRVIDWLHRPKMLPLQTAVQNRGIIVEPTLEPQYMKMATTWAFFNGGFRVHATSQIPTTFALNIAVTPHWTDEQNGDVIEETLIAPTPLTFSQLNGVQWWKPNLQISHTTVLPYYADRPLLRNRGALHFNDGDYTFGQVYYLGFQSGTSANYTLALAVSVADDFAFYFPLPMPVTYVRNVAEAKWYDRAPREELDAEIEVDGFVRDLTADGDVESNPGPTMLAGWIKRKIHELASEIADEQIERAKAKARELQSFLRKHIAENVVCDVLLPVLSVVMDIVLHIRLLIIDPSLIAKGLAIAAILLRIQGVVANIEWYGDALKKLMDQALSTDIPKRCWQEVKTRADVAKQEIDQARARRRGYEHVYEYSAEETACKEAQAEMHAGKDFLPGIIASIALASIVGVLGYQLSGKTAKEVKEVADNRFFGTCKNIATMGNAIRGGKEVWKAAQSGLGTALEYFVEPAPTEAWFKENEKNVNTLFDEYSERKAKNHFCAESRMNDELGMTPGAWFESNADLIEECAKHFPRLETKQVSVDRRRALQEILKYKCESMAFEKSIEPRHEPVGVWIYGAAGTGKSVFGKEVLPPLLHRMQKWKGKWTESVYHMPRDAEQRYYDGYTGQPLTYVDDFGQNTDDEDFSMIINLISSADCRLPQAAMENKLSTFRSRVVIASSNLSNIGGITTIKDKSAVARRFGIAVKLSIKPGSRYLKGKYIDYAALAAAAARCKTYDDLCAVYDDAYVIRDLNLLAGNEGDVVPFADFIARINDAIRVRGDPHAIGDAIEQLEMPAQFQMFRTTPIRKCEVPPPVARQASWQVNSPETERFERTNPFYEEDEKPQFAGLKKILIACGIVAGAALVTYVIVSVVKSFVVDKIEEVNFQHKYSEASDPKSKPTKAKEAKLNAYDDRAEKIDKHIIHARTNKGRSWAIVLDSRHVLMNRHCVEGAEELILSYDRGDGKDHEVRCSLKQGAWETVRFLGEWNGDAVVVYLQGANLDNFKHFYTMLLTAEQWCKMTGDYRASFNGEEATIRCARNPIWSNTESGKYKADCMPVMLGFKSTEGMCGLPYVLNGAGAKLFLGIHSAADTHKDGLSYFSPVSLESVMAARAALSDRMYTAPPVLPTTMQMEVVGEGGNAFYNGNLRKIGKCEVNGEKIDMYAPLGTDFQRSPFQHKEWADDFLPSAKTPRTVDGVVIHPMLTNSQKYKYHPVAVSPQLFHRALRDFTEHLPMGVGKVLDEHETLNGVGEMNKLVITTSGGFITRYCHKRDLFTVIEKDDGTPWELEFSDLARDKTIPIYGKPFVEFWKEQCQAAEQGVQPFGVWISTNKDELLKKAKVAIAKTRVFENPDVCITLMFRKYFGCFLNWFKQHRGFVFKHGIGMDVAAEAQNVYAGLLWKDRVFDVDYTNYDGSIPAILFDFFLAVTDKYYVNCGPEARKARHALVNTLRCSLHVIGDTVYESYQGNKSGNPMTDVFNSITNAGLLTMIYYAIYPDQPMSNHVRFMTYGDDVICSTSEKAKDFNRVSVAKWAAEFGMKVTSAAKTAEIEPYTDITEVSFLKGVFRPGTPFLFPIPLAIAEREIRWERKSSSGDMVVLRQRVENAVHMAGMHGPEAFQTMRRQIMEVGGKQLLPNETYAEWTQNLVRKQRDAKPLHDYEIPVIEGASEASFQMFRARPENGVDKMALLRRAMERTPCTAVMAKKSAARVSKERFLRMYAGGKDQTRTKRWPVPMEGIWKWVEPYVDYDAAEQRQYQQFTLRGEYGTFDHVVIPVDCIPVFANRCLQNQERERIVIIINARSVYASRIPIHGTSQFILLVEDVHLATYEWKTSRARAEARLLDKTLDWHQMAVETGWRMKQTNRRSEDPKEITRYQAMKGLFWFFTEYQYPFYYDFNCQGVCHLDDMQHHWNELEDEEDYRPCQEVRELGYREIPLQAPAFVENVVVPVHAANLANVEWNFNIANVIPVARMSNYEYELMMLGQLDVDETVNRRWRAWRTAVTFAIEQEEGRGQWVPDLTADGDVEANPGPFGITWQELLGAFWEGVKRGLWSWPVYIVVYRAVTGNHQWFRDHMIEYLITGDELQEFLL